VQVVHFGHHRSVIPIASVSHHRSSSAVLLIHRFWACNTPHQVGVVVTHFSTADPYIQLNGGDSMKPIAF
jgi:hypothetical protein